MKNRALGLVEVALARHTLQLPPGLAARMAIGAEVAASEPTLVRTMRLGTEVSLGVNGALAAQGHSVFVEALHDRFPKAIKGCVRGGALLARHPPREPQPSPKAEPDDNISTSAH